MNHKLSYCLFWVGVALMLILFLITAITEALWLLYVGIGVYFVAWLQMLLFVRCPHCGHNINPRVGGFAKFCPGCGKPLEW